MALNRESMLIVNFLRNIFCGHMIKTNMPNLGVGERICFRPISVGFKV